MQSLHLALDEDDTLADFQFACVTLPLPDLLGHDWQAASNHYIERFGEGQDAVSDGRIGDGEKHRVLFQFPWFALNGSSSAITSPSSFPSSSASHQTPPGRTVIITCLSTPALAPATRCGYSICCNENRWRRAA